VKVLWERYDIYLLGMALSGRFLPGRHVVDALRDDVTAAQDLQEDGGRVWQPVPVREARQATPPHLPLYLCLYNGVKLAFFSSGHLGLCVSQLKIIKMYR
jgi:hypothetical protein